MKGLPPDESEDDGPPICRVTGMYCTGRFCEDYGCAKEAGFYDTEDDDGEVY